MVLAWTGTTMRSRSRRDICNAAAAAANRGEVSDKLRKEPPMGRSFRCGVGRCLRPPGTYPLRLVSVVIAVIGIARPGKPPLTSHHPPDRSTIKAHHRIEFIVIRSEPLSINMRHF